VSNKSNSLLKVHNHIILIVCLLFCATAINAQPVITAKGAAGDFDLSRCVIYVDGNDFPLVKRSASLLQSDIEMVTSTRPKIIYQLDKPYFNIIVIGTVGHSSFIETLVQKKKLTTKSIAGKWEAYDLRVVNPGNTFMPVQNILTIIGSDRRGTAFGVFELSRQIGVSPWYWWADVPVKKKAGLFVKANAVITDAPKVKYRGIFINDEAPALSGWSKEKFGGFNHNFYEKVFELMLRLKANYLWPAMWGNAFYDDDSLNIKMADEYGIVIGTSHHEPLMRAHDEWKRYGQGKWNYDSNEARLKAFWRGGMQRATNEKVVSIGMRGDGDEPMSRETATALLERIVKDQRQIIEEVTGKPANETPQLWALYKEVQDYYDKGMRVPDDVTLLLCDDNWGNIRKLPKLDEKPRKGGYGIYYHFDYVGGPRNYKWLNTNPIPRVWEQMHLAWEYKAREIWIVNVGDIKPMEFPISFFLDYAWNPGKIGADDLQKYTEQWAAAQFGSQYAKKIAAIISAYSKYNGRRKPELLDADTYNINAEAQKVTDQYNALLEEAKKINEALAPAYRDAFFQLVLHPVKACANLQEMYTNVAWNRAMAKENLVEANGYADRAQELYENDSLITLEYHALANGKWDHMMDQTHIGYTYWQQPLYQTMPQVKYISPGSASMVAPDTAIAVTIATYPLHQQRNIFFEVDNYVSMDADHYTRAINSNVISWKILPDHGRTGNAVTSFPVTAAAQKPGAGSPQLQYEFYSYKTDSLKLLVYFSPTLNFHNTATGLQFAVSIDNEKPRLISLNKEDNNVRVWEKWVANDIIIKTTWHAGLKPGKHILKYWMVDSGIVLQKLVLDWGGLPSTYLGPEETRAEN
jgi:hypothetical protein